VRPASQVRIHTVLLLLSLVFLPITPSEGWKPTGGGDPLLLILGLLTATIGLPFLLLSATSPLVQAWLARAQSGAGAPGSAYRLFALSNLGSIAALMSYPVLVEPNLSIRWQAWTWSAGYGAFVLLSLAVAWRYGGRAETAASASTVAKDDMPSRADWTL